MKSKRRTILFVEDVLEYASQAIQFCHGATEDDLSRDEKLQFAVVRAIEVIGEACRNIPEDVRQLAPEIPWRKIITTRNIIAHHYFGLNLKMLWQVVQVELGPLTESMEALRIKVLELDSADESL